MKYTVGIVGLGVVGDAVNRCLISKSVTTVVYDKYKNIGSITDILNTDIVILCLPTPYCEKLEEYDTSELFDTCEKIRGYTGVVAVKSTVLVGTSDRLTDVTGLNIVHNPEFLSAKTAYEDCVNQKHTVVGTTKALSNDSLQTYIDFTQLCFPDTEISVCTSKESEFMKLTANSFYATKIQFFNEVYSLCQKTETDYNKVVELVVKNGWVNPMHTVVPGHDGLLSYGGMCLPKDTMAMHKFMKKHNSPHAVLEATVKERRDMRQ